MKFDWLLKCKCLKFLIAIKEEKGMGEKILFRTIDSVDLMKFVFDLLKQEIY